MSSCARRIAWAMPYEQIQSSAFFGRAVPMYGGAAEVAKPVWPQPFPYVTDLDKAKALMKEAGFASGLETTLSLDTGTATVGEPTVMLIQESLAKIGIKATIEKIPGANWRTTLNKKELPLVLNRFSGWLDYPEYYFYWNLPRQQFDLQHLVLPEQGDGRADRQGALHRGHGRIRQGREGVHRALHAARFRSFRSTSRSTTSRCKRPSAATNSGFTASRTSVNSSKVDAHSQIEAARLAM